MQIFSQRARDSQKPICSLFNALRELFRLTDAE